MHSKIPLSRKLCPEVPGSLNLLDMMSPNISFALSRVSLFLPVLRSACDGWEFPSLCDSPASLRLHALKGLGLEDCVGLELILLIIHNNNMAWNNTAGVYVYVCDMLAASAASAAGVLGFGCLFVNIFDRMLCYCLF